MDRRTFVKTGLAALALVGLGIRLPRPKEPQVDMDSWVVDWRAPMVPSDSLRIIAYNDSGNFILSEDGGRTWQEIEMIDCSWQLTAEERWAILGY